MDSVANLNPARAQVALELGNRTFAEVDDRSNDRRVGAAGGERFQQMARLARAARGDYRDSDRVCDRSGYREIVAGLGAVGVDRVDAEFARAEPLALARPFERVAAGRGAPAVDDDLASRGQPGAPRAPDLHREHNALAAE